MELGPDPRKVTDVQEGFPLPIYRVTGEIVHKLRLLTKGTP